MAASRTITLPGRSEFGREAGGTIFFVGTATTIITGDGFTFLTDPNFLHAGNHAHLGYGLTSKRKTNPAIEIEQLPRLDFCLLSHLHGDHWDRVAEATLDKSLPIITTISAAKALGRRGFLATEGLKPWDSVNLVKGDANLRLTAMPGKHGPGIVNALLPPVMGSMLEWEREGGTPFRLYISGDTLMHDEMSQIPLRFPDINLALLHLGGTRILGVLVTMDAQQGIESIRLIRPRKAIPIHYNDYPVFKSSLADFQRAVREAGLEEKVHYLMHGDTYRFRFPEGGDTSG